MGEGNYKNEENNLAWIYAEESEDFSEQHI